MSFNKGDKVYFTLHDMRYKIKHGTIVRYKYFMKKKYVVVQCDTTHGCYDLLPEDLYYTESEVKAILKREFHDKVNEVKKNIHTLEDLLKFMYNNDLTDWSSACINGWQTDWIGRVAVRELAKELLDIELGE